MSTEGQIVDAQAEPGVPPPQEVVVEQNPAAGEGAEEGAEEAQLSSRDSERRPIVDEGGFFPVAEDGEDQDTEAWGPKQYYHYFSNGPQKAPPVETPPLKTDVEPITAAEAWALAADLYSKGKTAEAQEAESLAAAMEAVEAAESDPSEEQPLLSADEPLALLKPMWFTTNIIQYKFRVLTTFGCVAILLSALGCIWPLKIDFALQGFKASDHSVAMDYDMMQSAVHQRQVYLEKKRTSVTRRRLLGEEPEAPQRQLLGEHAFKVVNAPTRRSVQWRIHVIYEALGNVLEKDTLEAIRDLELKIQDAPGYNDFCLVEPNGKACAQPVSAVGYYFPSFDAAGQPVLDGAGKLVDIAASTEALIKMGLYWFLGKEFTPNHPRTRYLRTDFLFAGPLEGFNDVYEHQDEQREKFATFAATLVPLLENASTKYMKVLYGGDGIEQKEISKALMHDLELLNWALLFIFLNIWIHCESFLLATGAMFQLILTMPCAYFFYRGVFMVDYWTLLNFLGFAGVFAIGVTNCLIMMDVFLNCHSIDKLEVRLAYTLRKAGRSIFLSTCTSAVAFMTICFIDIPVIRVFGLLMVLVVLVNFCFVMIWLPALLAIYHKHFQHRAGLRELFLWLIKCCEGSPRDYSRHQKRNEDAITDLEDEKCDLVDGRAPDLGEAEYDALTSKKHDVPDAPDEAGANDKKTLSTDLLDEPHHTSVLFLRDDWSKWIIRHRGPLLLIFAALILTMCALVSFTGTASQLPQLFPDDSNFHRYKVIALDMFTTSDNCDTCSGADAGGGGGGFVPDMGSGMVSLRWISFLSGTSENRWKDPALQDAVKAALMLSIPGVASKASISFRPVTNMISPENSEIAGIQLDTTASFADASGVRNSLATLHENMQNGVFLRNLVAEAKKRPTIDSQLVDKLTTKILQGPAVIYDKMKTDGADAPLPPARQKKIDTSNPNPMADTKYFLDTLPDQLPPSDLNALDVDFVWGIAGLKKETSSIWRDPFRKVQGRPLYDAKFKGTKAEQAALLKACKLVQQSKLTKRVKRCIMHEFADYIAKLPNGTFPSGIKAEFPLETAAFVAEFRKFTTGTSKDVGFSSDGSRLLWIRALFRTTIPDTLPSFQRRNHYHEWKQLLLQVNKNTTQSVTPAFQASSGWVDMMTEIVAVNGAKKSGIMAVLFVYVVVSNSIGSIGMGVTALLAVASVTLIVLGAFAASNWTVGAVEAISVTLLVGLSVDFIIHFCEAYITCGLAWRKPELSESGQRTVRTRAALAQVGVPLISAAVSIFTTAGIMWFCTIQIYSKVAQVLMAATIFSVLAAFVFVPAAMAAFGPEDMTGTWSGTWIIVRLVVGALTLVLAVVIVYILTWVEE